MQLVCITPDEDGCRAQLHGQNLINCWSQSVINVIASIKIATGKRAEFIAAFKDNLPAVHAENGCLEYYPAIDIESGIAVQRTDADTVTIIEKWESLDALRAHLTAPHMLSYRERVKDIVEGSSLTIVEPA